MDEHDRSNLQFLLSLTPEGLSRFLAQCDYDDILYATELLMIYKMEIEESFETEDSDMSEAQQVLSKFRLKHE